MHVSASDFQKMPGFYQDKALAENIFVTRNGRQHIVILSIDEYERLRKLAQRSLSVDELSEAEISAIEAGEMPAKYAYLNSEVD